MATISSCFKFSVPLKITACVLKSQIVFEIRKNNILSSLLCLEIHALWLCMLGTDRRVSTFILFLHACGDSAFWECLKRKLSSPSNLLQCRSCELYFCISGTLAFSYWTECCNISSILQSCLSGSFQAWIVYPILNSSVDQTCLNNYSNYVASNRWLAFHLDVFPWELMNVNLGS